MKRKVGKIAVLLLAAVIVLGAATLGEQLGVDLPSFAAQNEAEVGETIDSPVKSVSVEKSAVKRGAVNPVTIVTSDEVARIRLKTEISGGTSKTVTYAPTSSSVTYTDNGDGTATWILNIIFSYTSSDDEQIQNWSVWYRISDSTAWVDSGKKITVTVIKREAVTESEDNTTAKYDTYTVVSVSAVSSVVKRVYTPVTIVVTSDATNIRFNNQDGKTSAFSSTSSNVTSVTDNGDGTSTWVINYRFASAGEATWAVQCRGNAWSDITDACKFTINVTEE